MRKHLPKDPQRKMGLPLGLAIIVLATHILIPYISILNKYTDTLRPITLSLLIFFIGWSIMRLISAIINKEIYRLSQDKEDNLRERSMITRMRYIKIIIDVIIFIIIIALIMRQFESLRNISTGMLASAGVVGIIVAFSAQKGIANLLAGIQVAFTQPIRVDDVCVIEGEWGRIEEIKATYVVMKIWDQRRLILPISYFIEKPFTNWTRTSAEILGTIYIYTDYTIPIDKVRKHLKEFCKKHPLWDGRVAGLVVTDSKEHSLELRALVSAADSSKAWDLRCAVREELITYIQKNYPEALPKTRVLFDKESKK